MLNNNYPKKRTLKRAGKHYVYNKKNIIIPFLKNLEPKKVSQQNIHAELNS